MPHTEIDKKTLSAPNPISTVYKKLAFFDSADNKLCFTNDANLKDMEIVEISNPIHFTQGLTIGGTLKGEPRADGGTEIDLSGSIAQLFGDIYKGNSQGGGAASNYISTVGTKWGDADKGVIWSINQEYDQRTAADRDINQELDGIEKLIVDQAWNYDAIGDGANFPGGPWDWNYVMSSGSETPGINFLTNTNSIAGSISQIDIELKKHQNFLHDLWNMLQGAEGATEPTPNMGTYDSGIWDIGNYVTPNTYYISSKQDTDGTTWDASNVLARPGSSTDNTESNLALSSRAALMELDKEIHRNEVWTNKLNKMIDSTKDLNAQTSSGGALSYTVPTDNWSVLDNISAASNQTYMNAWGGSAPDGAASTGIIQAINNLDANMRVLERKIQRNYAAGGTAVGGLADNTLRANIVDLRVDINRISDSVNGTSGAGATNANPFAYTSDAGNTYASTDIIGNDINGIDAQLEFVTQMITGASAAGPQYTTAVNQGNIEADIEKIWDDVETDTNSINNRLTKVVNTDSEVVPTVDFDMTSSHVLLPKGGTSTFNDTANIPYGKADWGEFAVNKSYVDSLEGGIVFRPNVELVATSNVNYIHTGGVPGTGSPAKPQIDGKNGALDMRVLLVNQTDPRDNGIWIIKQSSAWQRPSDFGASGGAYTAAKREWTYWVNDGSTYENTQWNIGGDSTNYAIGDAPQNGAFPGSGHSFDHIVQMNKQIGLIGGPGIAASANTIVAMADAVSMYQDPANAGEFKVGIRGSSSAGATSGPYNGAYNLNAPSSNGADQDGNKFNPIAIATGQTSNGLYLKYSTNHFELSDAGELMLNETSEGERAWAYSMVEFAENASTGLNTVGGANSDFWGDATNGATHWARLRTIVGDADQQVAQLATDGKPQFDAVGIGEAADSVEPGGDGYRLRVSDTDNARIMVNSSANKDASVVFWTGATNAIRGQVGYDHGDSVMKITNGTGLDSLYDLCIDSSHNVGIGTATPIRRLHVVYPESSAQLRLERTDTDVGKWDIGANDDGLHFWSDGYDSHADVEVLFKPNGEIATKKALNIGPNAIGSGVSAGYSLEIHGDSGTAALMSIEADAGQSAAIIFRDPANIAGGVGHLDTASYDLISLTHGTGINTDAGLHIDEYGSIGFGTRVPTRNAGNDASSSYWQFGKSSIAANYPTGKEPDKFLQVCTDIPDDIVGVGLYIDDSSLGESKKLKRAGWFLDDKNNECYWHRTYHSGEPTYVYQWRFANAGDIMRIAPTGELEVLGTAPRLHLGDTDAADQSAGGPYLSFGEDGLTSWTRFGHTSADKHCYLTINASDNSANAAFKVKKANEILRVAEQGSVSINAEGIADAADTAELTIHSNTNENATLINKAYGTGNYPLMSLNRYRGTATARTIVADNDILGQIAFAGYTNNGNWGDGTVRGASILASVNGTPDAGTTDVLPTDLVFRTNDGTGATNSATISFDANFTIGDSIGSGDNSWGSKIYGYREISTTLANDSVPGAIDMQIGGSKWASRATMIVKHSAETASASTTYDKLQLAVGGGITEEKRTHEFDERGSFFSKNMITVGSASQQNDGTFVTNTDAWSNQGIRLGTYYEQLPANSGQIPLTISHDTPASSLNAASAEVCTASGHRDLTIYGSGNPLTLNLRMYDGDIKFGSSTGTNTWTVGPRAGKKRAETGDYYLTPEGDIACKAIYLGKPATSTGGDATTGKIWLTDADSHIIGFNTQMGNDWGMHWEGTPNRFSFSDSTTKNAFIDFNGAVGVYTGGSGSAENKLNTAGLTLNDIDIAPSAEFTSLGIGDIYFRRMRANDSQQAGVWNSSGLGAHDWCCGGLTVSSSYDDDQYKPTDGIYSKGDVRINTGVIRGSGNQEMFDGGLDEWLRLNSLGHYTQGIYTPGLFRADGGIQANSAATGKIDSAGKLTTTEIDCNGDAHVYNLYSTGDVVCNHPSDSKMKDHQEPVKNALEDISKLNGMRFIWNSKGPAPLIGKPDVGIIAQDVKEVYPELVTTRDNGDLGVSYNGLIPVLIEAVKELKGTVDKFKEANQVALDKILELESIIRRSNNG